MRASVLVAGHRAGTSTDRKASPALPVTSDMREAKTDAGRRGAWLSGCGSAAWGALSIRFRPSNNDKISSLFCSASTLRGVVCEKTTS